MGVNSEDDDGSGDAWNRNPKAGGLGDFDKPNYLLVILIAVFAVVAGVAVVAA